jgi:hypothetical protein
MNKIYSFKFHIFLIRLFILYYAIKKLKCDHWEYKLIHDILDGYNPSIRPSKFHNQTLNVTFSLALVQLIDVVSVLFLIFFFKDNSIKTI